MKTEWNFAIESGYYIGYPWPLTFPCKQSDLKRYAREDLEILSLACDEDFFFDYDGDDLSLMVFFTTPNAYCTAKLAFA